MLGFLPPRFCVLTGVPQRGKALRRVLEMEWISGSSTDRKDPSEQRTGCLSHGVRLCPRAHAPPTPQKRLKRKLRISLKSLPNLDSFFPEIWIFNSQKCPSTQRWAEVQTLQRMSTLSAISPACCSFLRLFLKVNNLCHLLIHIP